MSKANSVPAQLFADAVLPNSTVTSTGDARAHTLARHRDILLEFTQARLGALLKVGHVQN